MASNCFNFKHFAVRQDGCAMKVGTDGVLLGAWCRVEPDDDLILDVGTGTGLIAMMLAQRSELFEVAPLIEAIEIDAEACRTARTNFENTCWNDRLTAYCADAQYFTSEKRFAHIVSNPPWFMDSLASPVGARNVARHTDSLSYEALISLTDRLLRPDGRLSVILPSGVETEKMIVVAASKGFGISRKTEVYPTSKSAPKRTLMEFLRLGRLDQIGEQTPEIGKLTIETQVTGVFSEEYRALTRDFYLKF